MRITGARLPVFLLVVALTGAASPTASAQVLTSCFTVTPNPLSCNQVATFDGTCSVANPGSNIVAWDWDFDGDGTWDATGSITTHSYPAFGTYNPILRVTDDATPAQTATTSLPVSVSLGNSPPVALPGGPYQVIEGTALNLFGSGSYEPDSGCGDSIVSYSWDLDFDGTFDVTGSASPTVSWAQLQGLGYVSGATYTVFLEVLDTLGASGTALTTVTVCPASPTASFTAGPNPVACGQSVQFDASGSTSGPCNNIVLYEWDLDGNGTWDVTGMVIGHTFPVFGAWPVTLRVTNNAVPAQTATSSIVINVSLGNNPPIANHGGPYQVPEGTGLALNATGSFDPDAACGDSIVSYEWDLDNDGLFDVTGPASLGVPWSQLASLGYTAGTVWPLTLRVTDSFGLMATATSSVTICFASPIASFTATPNPVACSQIVQFNALGSQSGPCSSIVQYEWDFDGDGTWDLSGSATPTHAYASFGTYTATLRVTNDAVPPAMSTSSVVIDVTLGNNPPVANAGGPYQVPDASSVTLDASGSFDPDGGCGDSIVQYAWDLDDDGLFDELAGASATLLAPWNLLQAQGFVAGGTYAIAVRVTDTFGSWASASSSLTVCFSAPIATFTANPNPAACNQAITFDASGSTAGPCRTIVQYEWDFEGDGIWDLTGGPVISHAYGTFGTYTAVLRVIDSAIPAGMTTTTLGVIVALGNNPPVAVPGGPYEVIPNGNLGLNASASSDPDSGCGDTIVQYAWDLDNDGSFDDVIGTVPTTSVSWALLQAFGYTVGNTYIIGLQVTDSFGLTSSSNTSATICFASPVATFAATPTPAACNQLIQFDASASTAGPCRTIVQYDWDFDGDGIWDLTGGPVVSHAYPSFGTHTAILRVTDDSAPPGTATVAMTVDVSLGNNPPIADAGGPYQVTDGSPLNLQASGSSDPDSGCGDSIVQYAWDLDSDGAFDDFTAVSPAVAVPWSQLLGHGFVAGGTYTIGLLVTDSLGLTDIDVASVTVCYFNPVADFTVTPNPAACNQVLSFNAGASIPSACGSIVLYEWDFDGDGVWDSTSGPTVAHSYALFGTHACILRITDNSPQASSATFTVMVDVSLGNNAPIAAAGGAYEILEGSEALLVATGSSEPDAGCGDAIVLYEWDLDDDGVFSDLVATSATQLLFWTHIQSLGIAGLGPHPISLRVTDTFGATHTDTTTLTVQPAPTFPKLQTLAGISAGSRFGQAVSDAGDVNQDGVRDLIVGAPDDAGPGVPAGRAYVISGSTGSGSTGAVLHAFSGDSANESFGISVSSAGDVDGDGFADVIVGAPYDDNTGPDTGSARIFSGNTGLVLQAFDGVATGDEFGASVSGGKDFDGDGTPDVVIGAPGVDTNGVDSGRTYVYSGSTFALLLTMDGATPGDHFGACVAMAGDVNADGRADVVVGAPDAAPSGPASGRVVVISGMTGGVLHTFTGDSTGDSLGTSVSGAGDLNGDGFDDLVAGAPHDGNNGTDSGTVRTFSGSSGAILFNIIGNSVGDLLGHSVSSAGDANGDGFADIIAGAPGDDDNGIDSGSARIVSGFNQTILTTFRGSSAGNQFGSSVALTADGNGDGLPEIIAGSPFADSSFINSGSAMVLATCGVHPYDVGTPLAQTLTMDWLIGVPWNRSHGKIRVAGAAPFGQGALLVGTKTASLAIADFTLLVDILTSPSIQLPFPFGAAGSQFFPISLQGAPTTIVLHAQALEYNPTAPQGIFTSNGITIVLSP